jgi:hypothetical protein
MATAIRKRVGEVTSRESTTTNPIGIVTNLEKIETIPFRHNRSTF